MEIILIILRIYTMNSPVGFAVWGSNSSAPRTEQVDYLADMIWL